MAIGRLSNMRITYYQKDKDSEPEVTNVSTAKKLIKKQGGFAYTCHYDRGGGLFETSPIITEGNNSIFQYNQHL